MTVEEVTSLSIASTSIVLFSCRHSFRTKYSSLNIKQPRALIPCCGRIAIELSSGSSLGAVLLRGKELPGSKKGK